MEGEPDARPMGIGAGRKPPPTICKRRWMPRPASLFTRVKAETALSVLAYNVLRAINLVGVSSLRAMLA